MSVAAFVPRPRWWNAMQSRFRQRGRRRGSLEASWRFSGRPRTTPRASGRNYARCAALHVGAADVVRAACADAETRGGRGAGALIVAESGDGAGDWERRRQSSCRIGPDGFFGSGWDWNHPLLRSVTRHYRQSRAFPTEDASVRPAESAPGSVDDQRIGAVLTVQPAVEDSERRRVDDPDSRERRAAAEGS